MEYTEVHIKQGDIEITIKSGNAEMDELFAVFKRAALGLGYDPETVSEYFKE